MIIKTQRPINFINTCKCIVDYKELEKAIIWYSTYPVASTKKIYLHGNYPAISIHKNKIHVHRLLMSYWMNAKIPTDFFVHHINGNKLDNRKENLSIVYITTHQRSHNKGKVISDRQKQIISENNKKRKGSKIGITKKGITYQKIWDLYKSGYSINKISIELDYDWGQVKTRLNEIYQNPELLKEGE